MDQLDNIISVIALTMGVSWASGINLYAAIATLGILGATGNMALPPDLQILSNPLVIIAAATMYCVEFFADKVPGVDTGWDTIQTFVRIPGGALLAAGAVGEMDPAVSLAAAIVGGSMAGAAHATKSGTRVLINTSPEPVSNWIASLTEDVAVIGGLWAAFHYPWVFLGLLLLFILLMIWWLPKIWRGIKKVFGFLGRLFGISKTDESLQENQDRIKIDASEEEGHIEMKLEKLNDLFNKGLISQEDLQKKKQDLLNKL
jgi:hypothetical protein